MIYDTPNRVSRKHHRIGFTLENILISRIESVQIGGVLDVKKRLPQQIASFACFIQPVWVIHESPQSCLDLSLRSGLARATRRARGE